jgi:heat shock protein HslJ
MQGLLSPLRIIILLLISALVVTDCAMAEEAPATAGPPVPADADLGKVLAGLVGTEWVLEDLCGTPVVHESQATLTFTALDKVSGRGSVNRFGGALAIQDGKPKMGPFMLTRMAGPEPLMNQEQAYLDALGKATSLEVKGNTLTIHAQGKNQPLRFTRLNTQNK